MFTKKHYEKIAQIVKELPLAFCQSYWGLADTSYREELANTFAEEFASDNPNFNKSKFFDACDIHKESVIRNEDMVQVMGVYINKKELKEQNETSTV